MSGSEMCRSGLTVTALTERERGFGHSPHEFESRHFLRSPGLWLVILFVVGVVLLVLSLGEMA